MKARSENCNEWSWRRPTFASLCTLSFMLCTSCNSGSKQEESSQAGRPIDSTVVGKDTNSMDLRRDIDLSDPEKLVLPGRDSTYSDESAGKKPAKERDR
jgi:hypothetical protein